ncbi:MAG: class I SAM-dependent methyltransferase [Planctomycetota bacterium]
MNDEHIDAAMPLEPGEHEKQLAGVLALFGAGARVVDVGAGLGRLAIPLAERGCDVLAIDSEPAWLAGIAGATSDLPVPVRTREADALADDADLSHPAGPADAVLILGNTLALVHDTVACCDLFERLRGVLKEGGAVYIDHAHDGVWREVAEGNWQEGVSEDGGMRLVWASGDPVVALRTDGDARRDGPIDARDERMRLWSWGELRLLARASGFSDPEAMPGHHLVRFRCP